MERVFLRAAVVSCGSGGSGGGAAGSTRKPGLPSASSPTATARALVEDGSRGHFRDVDVVLENATHGPQLCVGGALARIAELL